MGVTIRQKRKGGPWWIFINHKGQRTSRKIGAQKAAEAVKLRLQAELAMGNLPIAKRPATSPPLKAYAQSWLHLYAQLECKESTQREYRAVLRNHVVPVLGDYRIDCLSPDIIRQFLADKAAEGLSRGTLRNIIAPVRKMLTDAVRNKLLHSNPAAGLDGLRRARTERDVQAFDVYSREELAHLLHVAERSYGRYYPLILCGARTGMREGELIALQWRDIDLRRRLIHVRRTFYRGRLTSTKNNSARVLRCSPQLVQVLTRLKDQQMAEAIVYGQTLNPDAWVFTNSKGGRLIAGNFTKRIWGPLLQLAGLTHIRFHDLRHTVATLLLEQGESLAFVQKQLGHSSIQVTVDIYGHLLPATNQSAIDQLDDAPTRTPGAPRHSEDANGPLSEVPSEPLNIAS